LYFVGREAKTSRPFSFALPLGYHWGTKANFFDIKNVKGITHYTADHDGNRYHE